jgi:hypothetical protein
VNTEGGVTADLCSLVSVSQLFDLIGNFTTAIALTPGVSKLVVMNTTATTDSPQNAYQHWLGNDRGNVAEVSAYSRGAAADGSDQITVINGNTLDNTCAFPAASAQQRIYWVNTPVSFSCADGRLVRYSNYFPDPFTVTAVRSGATEGVMADGVEDCAFSLVSPGGTLPPVLTATLTLKSDSGGTAKLIQQIGIENEL